MCLYILKQLVVLAFRSEEKRKTRSLRPRLVLQTSVPWKLLRKDFQPPRPKAFPRIRGHARPRTCTHARFRFLLPAPPKKKTFSLHLKPRAGSFLPRSPSLTTGGDFRNGGAPQGAWARRPRKTVREEAEGRLGAQTGQALGHLKFGGRFWVPCKGRTP